MPPAHNRSTTPSPTPDVLVIGAGPGGLAAAASVQAKGLRATVIDRAPHVGHTWRGHYDRLHLHTPRRFSHLPGLRIPREYGRWVSRADVVRYLERYAARHRLDLRLGVGVEALSRVGGFWRVDLADGTTLQAPHVIVATGYNNTPEPPRWSGLSGFTGELQSAVDYRNGRPFAGRDVLVVGPGNTGCEIAVDLAEWGAATVWLSVRTPPHIVPRSQFGWPTQASGILVRHLPTRLVDAGARLLGSLTGPDLRPYGMPRPTAGLYSQARAGRIPVQDVGIVAAIQRREVLPVAAVERFDGPDVVLADGARLRPDAVVVSTGYRRGLEPLVGGLGVLDADGSPLVHGPHTHPNAPGLWFTGFSNPISGMFRELAIDARKIAAEIHRQER